MVPVSLNKGKSKKTDEETPAPESREKRAKMAETYPRFWGSPPWQAARAGHGPGGLAPHQCR